MGWLTTFFARSQTSEMNRLELLHADRMANMASGPISRPWRRYLRFSIRGLIVLVLLIGVGLGWLVRSARIQREAVTSIQHAGGGVMYDWTWSNEQVIPEGKPWAPAWLIHLIGVDYFGHVTFAAISGSSLDADIEQVGRLTQLQYLYLASPRSDADLAHLHGLNQLSQLDLMPTEITDAGLAHLKGLTKLSVLRLRSTQVTDAGMKELKRALPRLTITR
jgi:internalin A